MIPVLTPLLALILSLADYLILFPRRTEVFLRHVLFLQKNVIHSPDLTGNSFVDSIIYYFIRLIARTIDITPLLQLLLFILNLFHFRLRLCRHEELVILDTLSCRYSQTGWVFVARNSFVAKLGAKFSGKSRLGITLLNGLYFTELPDLNKERDRKWLKHEGAHLVQYQFLGAQYIFESLIAQHTEGYSYTLVDGKQLNDYNIEQQAEILSSEIDVTIDTGSIRQSWL